MLSFGRGGKYGCEMQRYLPLLCLLVIGCDRPAEEPQPQPAEPASRVEVGELPIEEAPEEPDFEDSPGTVRIDRSGKFIDIPGEKSLCMPFEAPADVLESGAQVRFTAYLDASSEVPECRRISLISARRVD